jgi:hypothetical protein
MGRRSFKWVALVAIGLASVVAVSAATALAARSTASSFELVFQGRHGPPLDGEFGLGPWPTYGTFTSGTPFCASGTAEGEVWFGRPGAAGARRYTCADGSGSLTLSISRLDAEYATGASGEWAIVDGSGSYEDLRGKGTYTGELLGGNPADFSTPIVFRTIARGLADADPTPPSLAITSASATKLRRPAGAYSIHVTFSLRDDVEGNPVAYSLSAKSGPRNPGNRRLFELASKEGSTAFGTVSTKLRVFPSSKRVRSVQLQLSASDPNGNEVSITRRLKLPR